MSTYAIMFDQVISRGCGIDVHKENVVVTIRGDGIKEECRTFQTFTTDLLSCNDWLMEQKITHIAWNLPAYIGNRSLIFWRKILISFLSMHGILRMSPAIKLIVKIAHGLQSFY